MVGTAHVSRSSIDEVVSAIRQASPGAVAVELCQTRYDVMKNPALWQNMDIFKIIKEKRASFLLANLVMSSFQRRIGQKLGVKPGDEMRAAIGEAEASGIDVVLVDRNVQVTLARAWRRLSFWEKMKMIYASLVAVFEAEDIDEQDIERLKEKDMLTTAVEEMARHAPTIKEVLIDERDAYMARKIADIPSDKVVAVVGAGHMKGIHRQMENPVDDLSGLEEVPPGAGGFWAWVLPLLVMGFLVSGFFFGGPERGYDMLKWWAVSTMVCTALATIIVFAHPVTILVATLSAPLTTLHPALASGWFAGLSEAYMKKPRVVDFERIHDDIMTLRGWWSNPVTRILLVFFMSNLGSSIGVFIAAPVLARMALG